ncbi:hypothetical protein HRI_005212200 [Hibiscus trionum]|uniref:DUF4216 domain-containing protein n=1 Tax=Hibiscus trionum TaxID=183268 RepID=A0A9W7MWT3_HIBTR|nr:hypothetical protein HRI_005212200 [Hibiscus trionum]
MGIRYELHATSAGDGRPLLGKQYKELSLTEWAQARMYVLENCIEIKIFVDMHKETFKREDTKNIEKRHAKKFHQWFKNHVCQLYDEGSELVNNQLFNLACGHDKQVFRYTSYLINGWRLIDGKCIKKQGLRKINLNFLWLMSRKLRTEEPYVLASQAEQVYFVKDIKDSNYQVAVKTKPRDLYDLPCEDVREEPCQENEKLGFKFHEFNVGNDDNDVVSLDRPQLGITLIEGSPVNLDVITDVEDERDESDHDEFTSINDEDHELDLISDAEADNDDDN